MSFVTKLILVALLVYGWQHQVELYRLWRDWQGNKQQPVRLVTADGCGSLCTDAQVFLQQQGIAFENWQANQDGVMAEVQTYTDLVGVPMLIVGNEAYLGYSPLLWLSAIAEETGRPLLNPQQQNLLAPHFNNNAPQLVLYGTSWCGYCKELRTWLKENHIHYTDIDVERHPESSYLSKGLGISGYPTVFWGRTHLFGSVNDIERQIKQL